jgi:hypothetical protein
MVTMSPAASAACVTPPATEEKYGSSTPLTTNAAVFVVPLAIACADRCGV